jgi:orotidine 5'-phosphate decarboxylase subfamily 2
MFFDRIEKRAREIESLLCVGLDPHPELTGGESLDSFCKRIIDSTAGAACAYKPNSAFFEAHGAEGFNALRQVIAHVPEGIPVILDAKRGDIASTAEAYAQACFEHFGADAITLNPFLGLKALEPFKRRKQKGMILLCRSTNPGADLIQDMRVNGRPFYLHLARTVAEWCDDRQMGLVMGATDPIAIENVRRELPTYWFLTPGVGAQGGNLERSIRAGLRSDGLGVLLAISRGIATAESPRSAALQFRDQINENRSP